MKKREVIVIISTIILSTLITRGIDEFGPLLKARIGFKTEEEKCPPEMVFVPSARGGFCIDKYENSPGPNCPFQNPKNQLETRENLNDPKCKPISAPGKIPWRYISQTQAQTACAKAGKRLPTNEEWYLAALGTVDLSSSWGSEDCHVSNNWNSQPGLTGSAPKCVSAAGAYDMIGNVWEWTQEIIIDGTYEKTRSLPESGYITDVDPKGIPISTNPNEPDPNYNQDYLWISRSGVRSFVRGGYWGNGVRAGIYSIYLMYQPSSFGPGVGFRCVK